MGNKITQSSTSSIQQAQRLPETAIVYLATHGNYNVPTYKNEFGQDIEIDQVGLVSRFKIPENMTVLKYNLVPIGICNYLGLENTPEEIHHSIMQYLQPDLLMARYGFNYFLSEDPELEQFLRNKGVFEELEKCRRFSDVPVNLYGILKHIAVINGHNENTILDESIQGLNEDENVIHGNNIIMEIISESIQPILDKIKKEVEIEITNSKIKLEELRRTDPEISALDILVNTSRMQKHDPKIKKAITRFYNRPDVKDIQLYIDNRIDYIRHVDDLSKTKNWNISIPNGRERLLFDKIYSLGKTENPDGLDWNITLFDPKIGTTESLFTSLKPENRILNTDRSMNLSEIIEYLDRIGVKNVILIDESCSVFLSLNENDMDFYATPHETRRWTNIFKKLNKTGAVFYGGKKNKKRNNTMKNKRNKKNKNKKSNNI
jgi:hypothetical protein